MKEICRILAPSLALYAEGELADPRLVRRIRRHLDGCAACRLALAEHDAGTRHVIRVLSDADAKSRASERFEPSSAFGDLFVQSSSWRTSDPSSGDRSREASARRRARILASIEKLPPPASPSENESGGLIAGWRPRFVRAAAAILLGAALLGAMWELGFRALEHRVDRHATLSPADGGASLAGIAAMHPGGEDRAPSRRIDPLTVARFAWYPRERIAAGRSLSAGERVWLVGRPSTTGATHRDRASNAGASPAIESEDRWLLEVIVLDRRAHHPSWVLLPDERIAEAFSGHALLDFEGGAHPVQPGEVIAIEAVDDGTSAETNGFGLPPRAWRVLPRPRFPLRAEPLPASDAPRVDPLQLADPPASWMLLPPLDLEGPRL